MWTRTTNGVNDSLVLHVPLGCGSLSITTPVSLLTNEFDVRSALCGQLSLEAVNHIYVFHEVINNCKNLKIIKACFENVNIEVMTTTLY